MWGRERPGAPPPREGPLGGRVLTPEIARRVGRVGLPPDLILPGRPFPRLETGVSVIRPDDLLVLTFDRINLRLETIDGRPHLVKAGDGPAYLVAEFPPQHIIEEAYFESAKKRGFPVKVTLVTDREKEELAGGDASPWNKMRLTDPDIAEPAEALEPPPIPARISRPSRLVFRVPDEELPLEFSLASLLASMSRLDLSAPINALPPTQRIPRLIPHAAFVPGIIEELGEAPLGVHVVSVLRARRKVRTLDAIIGSSLLTGTATRGMQRAGRGPSLDHIDVGRLRVRPTPKEPEEHQTSIELPYRLAISPPTGTGWIHRTTTNAQDLPSPDTSRVELWHTRLGVPVETEHGREISEEDHPRRIVRAVWARDQRPKVDDQNPMGIPNHSNSDPFRASLDGFDRWNVVHLSSNFALEKAKGGPYDPPPVDVDLLMLSALGGWLDSRGAWDFPQPRGLSVEEWRHRATLGRDHYVRVVYSGSVLPCGNRTSVIKVTERRSHESEPGDTAYLRQSMYVVVREPLRFFRNTGWKHGDTFLDLMWPFETMRITNLVSPALDPPEDSEIDGMGQGCFWPMVGGKPYLFDVVATDAAGQRVDMAIPLIFIGKEHTDPPWKVGGVVDKARQAYEEGGGQVVPLSGQKVAFAEPSSPDDTSFAVESLTVGVGLPDTYDQLPFYHPRYLPVVKETSINVPAMQRIARTNTPAAVVYAKDYVENQGGFSASDNAGQVFLAASPGKDPLAVAFSKQGDRSGALIAPDLSLGGVSRITGPVSGSDLTQAVAGTFDPSAWFGDLLDAKLLGAFKLSDVLDTVGFDDLGKIPRFASQNLNVAEKLVADLQQLVHDAADPAGLQPAVEGFTSALGSGSLPALPAAVEALRTSPPGGAGQVSVILQRLAAIDAAIGYLQDPGNAGVLAAFAGADQLPERLTTRLEWRPALKSVGPFEPQGALILTVEAADALGGAGEGRFTVTASLEDFDLVLPALNLKFQHLLFRVVDGQKPDVEVVFKDQGIEFTGPLAFVETLRSLIPFDGFADPPSVSVTPQGIEAGFSMGLPDLAVGVFSLQNLSLQAGLAVPFVGPPASVWFRFCERENPALLTVTLFGGGAFVGVTVNVDGLYILEAALEFGAAIAINLGVAAGGVSAMGGVYFKLEGSQAQLTGYFRLRGEVEALGIVSVSLELYLDLTYEFKPSNKCVGSASISMEIEVAMFSETITITTTKKFAGAGSDPTFREMLGVAPDGTSEDWEDYCVAFA